jgi:hypothetical protein
LRGTRPERVEERALQRPGGLVIDERRIPQGPPGAPGRTRPREGVRPRSPQSPEPPWGRDRRSRAGGGSRANRARSSSGPRRTGRGSG